ncbi:MAG: hypothetical protein AAF902_04345, partial [Chloroflexota bacterium]
FVVAGIIFGILYVTRINPSLDIQGFIDEQLDNPTTNDIDLSLITAEEYVTFSRFTRGSMGNSGVVLMITNQTSFPPNWVGELQMNTGEDQWEAVNNETYLFDSNNEIALPSGTGLAEDGVYRWVVKPGETSSQILGTSAPFLMPTSEDILDIEVEVR